MGSDTRKHLLAFGGVRHGQKKVTCRPFHIWKICVLSLDSTFPAYLERDCQIQI